VQGFVKIGDFGFAKVLESNNRTYTFCGTPGYVAPENGEGGMV
jgi:cGMP-dependent protein kinase 2